jgi:hypothetical protein
MPIQAINEQRRNCVKYKRRDLTGSYYWAEGLVKSC